VPTLFALVLAALCLPVSASAQTTVKLLSPIALSSAAIAVVLLITIVAIINMSLEALVTVRRSRIEQLIEEGNKAAKRVSSLLSQAIILVPTLRAGAALIAILAAAISVACFWPPVDALLGKSIPNGAVRMSVSLGLVVLGFSLFFLVFGEIVPKSIALARSEQLSLRTARLASFALAFLSPVLALVRAISQLVLRPFGGTAAFTASAFSEDELKIMVEQSEEFGVIESGEREMIHNVFEFADTTVRKVMTPRLDITAVPTDASIDDLVASVGESGHSRLPVYDADLDHIVGVIHVKDVLRSLVRAAAHRGSEPVAEMIRDFMRPPYFVPETKRIDDLLADFRRGRRQFAVVRDEYGTVTGVVTIEDLIEEIVGDIQDEYDEEEPEIRQIDERTCIADGRMTIDDFNQRMGTELPVEDSDTLGGFVFGLVGHQPTQGETATWDGLDFGVEATDGKRILRVRVSKSKRQVDPEAEAVVTDLSSSGQSAERESDVASITR
jgi:putative hemolysin